MRGWLRSGEVFGVYRSYPSHRSYLSYRPNGVRSAGTLSEAAQLTAKRHLHNGDQLAWLKGEPQAALVEYQKALELDPALALAHWRIGQVYFFAPEPSLPEAVTAFTKAVRLEPDWTESHYWLGVALATQKRYPEALAEIRRAIALAKAPDERLLISLGRCLYEYGQYAQAVEAYKEGIKAALYESADYHMMLADAQHACGHTKQACNNWKRVVSMRGSFDKGELAEKARENLEKFCSGYLPI